jgi:DNA invertase Pin-like site-specific DNA recombinase
MHAINTGLKKTGVDAYNSKFNKENILEIKKLFLEKISMKNIAKMYNVDYRTIWQIKNEKSYKNIKLCQ